MNKEKTKDQIIIEQLMAENELKTKWLSLIAHDFKGLFTNIQLLLNAYDSGSITQEQFISMLPELKQIAEKNSKTLKNTFEWVNSQTEGFKLHVEKVSIHAMILSLMDELDESIRVKEISIEFIEEKEVFLNTDIFLLKFILKQILENAIKYTNNKGVINVIAHSDSNSQHVIITIKDNGVGMDNRILNHLGTLDGAPYTGTMQEKGAGLSLVIVSDFVKKLNGNMSIYSMQNEGSSIELQFPKNINETNE